MSASTSDHATVLTRLGQTAARLATDLDELLAHSLDMPSLPLRLALAHALALSDQLAELGSPDAGRGL